MLSITIRAHEGIVLARDGEILAEVALHERNRTRSAKLIISAPDEVRIHRRELPEVQVPNHRREGGLPV